MNKTTWNFRVVKSADGTYGIREAYYTNDELSSITENVIKPYGQSYNELTRDFEMQRQAFTRPIIDEVEFIKEHCKECKDKCFSKEPIDIGNVEAVRKLGIVLEPPAFDYDDDEEGVQHLP